MATVNLILNEKEQDTLLIALNQAWLRLDIRRQHAKTINTISMLEDQMSEVLMMQNRVNKLSKGGK